MNFTVIPFLGVEDISGGALGQGVFPLLVGNRNLFKRHDLAEYQQCESVDGR